MAFDVPKEFFIVGFENKDGTLGLYADFTDPARFDKYERALWEANRLNSEAHHRAPEDEGTEWKVYRMKIENVEQPEIEKK